VSVGGDNRVKVWDVQTKRHVHTLMGEAKRVYSVCVARNGKSDVLGGEMLGQ